LLPAASAPIGWHAARSNWQGATMLDVILIAVALGFFALCIIYAFGCERL